MNEANETMRTMRKVLLVSSLGAIVLLLFIWEVFLTKQNSSTDFWRVGWDYYGDTHYYIEHLVGNQSTRYPIEPPEYEGDEDPLNGLEVLDVKDSTLVLLGATGRLYAYNTSTRGLFLLVDGIQSYKYQPEEKRYSSVTLTTWSTPTTGAGTPAESPPRQKGELFPTWTTTSNLRLSGRENGSSSPYRDDASGILVSCQLES